MKTIVLFCNIQHIFVITEHNPEQPFVSLMSSSLAIYIVLFISIFLLFIFNNYIISQKVKQVNNHINGP